MANVPISGLASGAAVESTDLFPDVQTIGVGPVKVTAQQIKDFTSISPSLITPNIGVATGTSLALGGATLGSNALAVTGTVDFNSALTLGTQQTIQGDLVLSNTSSGAYETHIKSSNSASVSWNFILPPTPGTNKYALTTDGTGASTWTQIDLTAAVTGTLPVDHGGTGKTSLTAHGVVLGNAASAVNVTSAGLSGQIFQSKGASSDPDWTTATFPSTATSTGTILRADGTNWVSTTATYPSTTTINQILYSDANNQVTGLTTANGGVVNTNASGVPSVTVNPKLGVQQTTQGSLILANTAAGAFETTIKSSNSASEAWTLTLPVSKGTSGYILTTDGTGVSAWTNPTALGIDIDVNSTAITGGTSGRIVYDNAGTFGEISAITTNGSDTLTVGVQQTTQGSVVLANTAVGAFPVTIKSSNSTSAAWSFTLPTTAGTNKYALTTDGSGVSSWSQIDLASAVSGTLPVGNGGTGQTSLAIHGVVIGNSTSGVNVTATGSAGQVFQSGGATSDPVWSTATFPSTATGTGSILRADGTNWAATTATFPATTTAGTILVSATANAITGSSDPVLGVQQTTQGSIVLANTAAGAFSTTLKSSNSATEAWTLTLPVSKGTNGYILTTDGTGVSSWTNPTALGIDIDINSTAITSGTSGRLLFDNSATVGETSDITTNGSGTLTIGTQQTTQGSLVLGNTAVGAFATTVQSSNSASAAWTLTLPTTAGTNNYVLTTNGSGVSSWSQVSLTAGVTGTLPVGNGGTGQSSNTIHGVLIGNAGNAINATAAGSAGQLLTSGGAASDPDWTTATFPSTATSTGTILRADGANWVATTATYPATTTINQILYSDANNQVTGLTTANGGVVNTNSSGVPSVTVNPQLGVQQTTQGSLILANTAAGAFETTIKSSNSASEAWTLTLPVSKGTSGYILTTDGTGVSAWTNPTALGIDIDVNSTAITSGVSGRLVYDNAGTFGEISAITTNGSDTLTVGVQQTTQGSVVLANTAVGAFPVTVQSSNSTSAAWTLTLPTTAGTNNYVLTTNGSGVSSWSQVSLTAGVTGTLPVGNGGTGTATAFTTGSVVFAGASGVYSQNNSNFFWDNTNKYLGLGTASPSDVLHTRRDANATTGPIIQNRNGTGTPASGIRMISGALDYSDNRYAEISSSGGATTNIAFKVSNSGAPLERMTLDYLGNLSIGSTSPSTYGQFSVIGLANRYTSYNNSNYQLLVRYDDNGNSEALKIANYGLTAANQSVVFLMGLGAGGVAANAVGLYANASSDYSSAANSNADLLIKTSAAGTLNTRMTISSLGNIVCNNAAIATNATDGFLYIPSCAGTPTGVPTSYAGRIPMVYDSTNNKLYVYNGAWKSATYA